MVASHLKNAPYLEEEKVQKLNISVQRRAPWVPPEEQGKLRKKRPDFDVILVSFTLPKDLHPVVEGMSVDMTQLSTGLRCALQMKLVKGQGTLLTVYLENGVPSQARQFSIEVPEKR